MICQICTEEVATRKITVTDKAGHVLFVVFGCPECVGDIFNSVEEEVKGDDIREDD